MSVSIDALLAYVVIAVYYASTPHYYDSAEPTMMAVGWLFEVGQPVHHGVDAAERYAHICGPLAFVAHGLAMGLFGPSVAVSKWLGVAAALASLVFLYATVRRQLTGLRAITLTGLCALLFLMFRNRTFWTRPEPLLLLCAAAALYAVVRRAGVGAALVAALWHFSKRRPRAVPRLGPDIGGQRPFARDASAEHRVGATLARPILVFHNNAYFLDQPAVQEHQLSGLEVPGSTIRMLRACRVDFWLIPKGQEPFSARSGYPAMRARPLFFDAFRQAFRETYRLQAHTTYYDVWQCRTGESS